MKYPYLFSGLLLLIVLCIALAFGRMFAFPDSSWPLDKGERVIVLPGEILTQTLVANRDGLKRLEILFGKFTLQDEDELVLELRDGACETVLSQKILSGQSFDSEYTKAFIFDRIPDSQDQRYCLAVNFATNRPVAKDKAPRFFIDKGELNNRPSHTLTNPGSVQTEGTGPIAIRPGYTNETFFANADEFFDRISQYKPVFLKSWFLVVFSVAGLVLTFLTTFLLIREEEE